MERKINDNSYRKYAAKNYIVSECNKSAWRASMTLIDDIQVRNSPLTLYGASGSGKTHLAHSIIELMQQKGNTALQLSAFDFIEQLVVAITNHEGDDFRHNLISYDMLVIDDIQHFIGRMGCQGELGIILDKRISLNKPTMFTSSDHPIRFSWDNKQLESRLLSGMIIKLELPDREAQIQMLKQHLDKVGIALPYDVMSESVRTTSGNGWLIEGVAKQLIDMTERGENITKEMVTGLILVKHPSGDANNEKEVS